MNIGQLNPRSIVLGVGALGVLALMMLNATGGSGGESGGFYPSLTTVITWAPVMFILVYAFGGFKYYKLGSGKGSMYFFIVATSALVLLAIGGWVLGPDFLAQKINDCREAAKAALGAQAASAGSCETSLPSFSLDETFWQRVTLGLLALVAIIAAVTNKSVGVVWGIAATIIVLPLTLWFAAGALPVEFKETVKSVTPFVESKVQRERRTDREALLHDQLIERDLAQRQIIVPTLPPGGEAVVVVPSCGSGWKQVSVPAYWSVTSAWNEKLATTEWRDSSTGQFAERSDAELRNGSFDAVRYCTSYSGYAGDSMPLTWKFWG